MAGPTLEVAAEAINSGGSNTNALSTSTFSPAANVVIQVNLQTWDRTINAGTPAATGLTFTKQEEVALGAGFFGYVAIWTAIVPASPTSYTITATPASACRHFMTLKRWASATLDPTPATNSTVSGSGAPSAALTTTAPNSVVSWASGDENSVDPATRAYLLSATEDGLYDGHVGSNYVFYDAHAAVASASTVNIGMSLPTGESWVMAGIEIKASAAASAPGPQTLVVPQAAVMQASTW